MQGRAVERLYHHHASAIEAHCSRLLGQSADATDAVHETFVRVLSRAEAHVSDEHAVRSLFRISTHVCIDLLRQRGVRRRALPDLMAHAPDPHARAEPHREYEARERVALLLDGCDELARDILRLHGIEGMRCTEVACALGTTRRTVFSRWKRIEDTARRLAS
jgi:RNA polymerase sigma-70 factor, ECF subfamily